MATKTYLRKQHKGYYFETSEPIDAEYWAGKIGSTYQDFLDNKWILLSAKQVKFHKDYPQANVKEVINMELTPVPPRTLEQAKSEKLSQIQDYDDSEDVNIFHVVKDGNTIDHWFTPNVRSDFYSSIIAAENKGEATLQLYLGEIPVTLPTEVAKSMLSDVQLYANACANVTKAHVIAVEALGTIEAVDGYDYTLGYPESPTFTIDAVNATEEEGL